MAQLLEEILSEENIELAIRKVKSNNGASGIDGITTKVRREIPFGHGCVG